jgi:transposase
MEAVVTEEIIARQPPEAQAIIRLLLARIASLEAENAELKARIEELERRVKGRTPQNSSLPPSTQHPHARPQPPTRNSKRKRGGQPGHKKHERPLIPTEECDDVQPLKPSADAVGRSSRAATGSRCGTRSGKCPRSSRT